jgi:ATP-dependent Clp protease protease subunit
MPIKKFKIDSDRMLTLFGEIDGTMSSDIIKDLLVLDMANDTAPIYLLINSEGGDVHSALAIHDIIKSISAPVYTVGSGQVMSAGSLIFAAGDKRYSFPHTWFMLHSISFSFSDVSRFSLDAQAKHSNIICDQVYELYAKYSKKTKEQIKMDLEAGDVLLDAQGALSYGILDKIISI